MQRQQNLTSDESSYQDQFEHLTEAEKLRSSQPGGYDPAFYVWLKIDLRIEREYENEEKKFLETLESNIEESQSGPARSGKRRHEGAQAERAEGPRSSLDKKENNSIEQPLASETEIPEKIVICSAGCKCGMCTKCGPQIGGEIREKMQENGHLFPRPSLLTLTVDLLGTKTGKGFQDAKTAFLAVNKGQYISKLLKLMRIDTWVRVLEFQENGSPHWHILVDLPPGFNMQKARKLLYKKWRDDWGVGGILDFGGEQKNRDRFNDAEHAINYITKYLTKPEDSTPEWALEMRSIRRIQASHKVPPLRRKEPKKKPMPVGEDAEETEEKNEKREKRIARKIIERISSCGNMSLIMDFEPETTITAKPGKWFSTIVGSRRDIFEAVEKGEIPGVRIFHFNRENDKENIYKGYGLEGIDAKNKVKAWSARPEVGLACVERYQNLRKKFVEDYQAASAEAAEHKKVTTIESEAWWYPAVYGTDRACTRDEVFANFGWGIDKSTTVVQSNNMGVADDGKR